MFGRHFCLPLTSVYVKLSKIKWRKPLQMEDATCIRLCAVITHRATINLFERLCSPALQKESPRIWKETSHYCWVNNASSFKSPPFCWNLNGAHLRWVGPFQTRASSSLMWLSTQQNNLQRKSNKCGVLTPKPLKVSTIGKCWLQHFCTFFYNYILRDAVLWYIFM